MLYRNFDQRNIRWFCRVYRMDSKAISTSSDGLDSARLLEEEGMPENLVHFNNKKTTWI